MRIETESASQEAIPDDFGHFSPLHLSRGRAWDIINDEDSLRPSMPRYSLE